MSTTIDRIPTTGHSGAAILAAGMGGLGDMDHSDPFYRAIRRIHKREILELCERRSIETGRRLPQRVLP